MVFILGVVSMSGKLIAYNSREGTNKLAFNRLYQIIYPCRKSLKCSLITIRASDLLASHLLRSAERISFIEASFGHFKLP